MSGALSPEDRLRLEELFERAAELPPAEHAAFLERECAPQDGALHVELARLLAGLAGEDIVKHAQPVAPSLVGTQIGPYKLLEKIGEGGMGEVYAADQQEPVKRRVALKVIKPGMDSAQVVARFEAERQALARMSHAHVAQVFDGGTTTGGRPYFVMEFVAGEPITEYCDRRKLSTRDRIELFLGVCEGVQHAHQKGLIHRDLKPSNLLVTQQDGRAVPKIIDFGVARATTGRLAERTLHTMVGQIVGTLDYMSPEQADPTGVDIDTRSDIYSLGVVLYQLVSGLLPFDHSSAAGLPLSELQRAIREQNAPTPSTRLKRQTGTATAIAQLHGTDERSLVRQLHGDLDWICLKALEKDPARRYASASELAVDLRRHLAHEPVLAGRPGALYRARKFVRRNRMTVIAGVLVTLAAGGGIFGILLGQLLAHAQRPQADAYSVLQLKGRADKLWPPYPDKIKALVKWRDEALNLDKTLEGHRLRLTESRERALEPDGTEDLEPYSRVDDLTVKSAQLELFRTRMERELLEWKRAKEDEFIAKLKMEIPALEAERDDRRTWSFASVSDSSRHAVLAELVKRLENLRDEETGLLGTEAISPEHGWSVPKRLTVARDLEVGFAPGGVYAEAWEAEREAITKAYPGPVLEPQMGLLPLGSDPDSGLWEFWHMASGAEPVRGPDGELVVTGETGIVLVLIPGGKFWMGAQSKVRGDQNYDPQAAP